MMSSSTTTTSTSSSNTINNSPTIQSLQGPNDALPYIKQFEKLSSGTEMDAYKEPQWRFLLSGVDVVTAAIIQSSGDNNKEEEDDSSLSMKLGGSACKVSIDENTYGLGMVLVDPANRGKGYAKALINTSMGVSNNDNNKETKYILANCNEMGAPVYRKLGFKDCGTNSFLSCSVSDIINTFDNNNDEIRTVSGGEYTNEQLSLLTKLDAKATGLKRKERIELLAKGDYAKQFGSSTTLAFIGNDTVGVARQDCTNGPIWIGPIIGDEKKVIPLLKVLIDKHIANDQKTIIKH